MANLIQVKRSSVPGKVPLVGDLALGEIAINTYDGIMYIKMDNGVQSIMAIGGGGDFPRYIPVLASNGVTTIKVETLPPLVDLQPQLSGYNLLVLLNNLSYQSIQTYPL
jgi:hypothetical protein